MYQNVIIPGYSFAHLYEEVGSTMDVARELIGSREVGVVVARRQTAGRGRQGRSWLGAGAALMATFIFPTSLRVSQLSGYSLAVGVRIAEALRLRGSNIQLKWPNDLVVVLNEKLSKLGGILIEVEERAGKCTVLVGLGLNIDGFPGEITDAISLRAAFGCCLSMEETLELIASALLEGHREFESSSGFSRFADRWLGLSCFRRGCSALTVDLGKDVVSGSFEGVDDRGALRLRVGSKEQVVYSGHVLEWRL